MNNKSYWSEVRNNYFETELLAEEGDTLARISIDAWRTPDENEEGSVIAHVILSKHGDVMVSYHDNIARTDPVAQEAIQDAKQQLNVYYLEQAKMAAPLWDHSTAFQLPDGSSISILLKQGRVGRDAEDSRQWCSVDIVRDLPNQPSQSELLCSVDYEDALGLRTLVFSPDEESPVFTQTHAIGEQPLQSFYYTFGTSQSFPFERGWVEVQATDRKEANQLFRAQFPDKIPGIINCAFIYDAEAFERIREVYKNDPNWNVCHQVITPDTQHQRSAPLADQIRNAESRKPAASLNEDKGPER